MPYLGSTIFVLVIVLAFLLSVGGYLLLVRALWPQFASRAEERWTRQPLLCFLLGVPLGVVGITVSLLMTKIPLGGIKLMGLLLLSLVVGMALAGVSGLAGRIGASLSSSSDESRAWMRTLRGGLVLELSFVVPVLGWLVILPLALLGGVGASVLAALAPFARAARPLTAPPVAAPAAQPTVSLEPAPGTIDAPAS